jgi:hypothetical protein
MTFEAGSSLFAVGTLIFVRVMFQVKLGNTLFVSVHRVKLPNLVTERTLFCDMLYKFSVTSRYLTTILHRYVP